MMNKPKSKVDQFKFLYVNNHDKKKSKSWAKPDSEIRSNSIGQYKRKGELSLLSYQFFPQEELVFQKYIKSLHL